MSIDSLTNSSLIPFDDYTWPAKSPVKPYRHQVVTTEMMLRNKRLYVLNDMGTGKTLSALWACDFLMLNQKIKRVLIIGPLSTLQSVWAREIFMHLPHRKCVIAHGNRDVRVAAFHKPVDFVITNHDAVTNYMLEILSVRFDIIIIDELTAFKNATSKRTKAMRHIAAKVKGIWGMTGNPIANGPLDAFGQCLVVNPHNLYVPKYITQFKLSVCQQITTFIWVPKPDADKTVYKMMQPAIRFKREDCIDLPDIVYETRTIKLSADQTFAYNTMLKELIIEYDTKQIITAKTAATKMLKLLQISSGSLKDDMGGLKHYDIDPKLNFIIEMLNETPQHKLIVVCMFRATCIRLTNELQQNGINAALIYGSIDLKVRADVIHRFSQPNNDIEILVVQVATVAHGVTLTAASTMVFWDLTPSFEQYEQMCARIRRIGQVSKQLIINMISTPTDKHILSIIERKEKFATVVMEMFRDILNESV